MGPRREPGMQRGIDVAKEMTNVGLARQTEGSLTSFKDSRTNRPCGESEFSHEQRMPVCKAEAAASLNPAPPPTPFRLHCRQKTFLFSAFQG